jgi:uncharacterized protein YebE (UPF0316 family)
MKLLVLFIVLSVVNVILQTFKSLATIKCGPVGAATVNALAYGLYTVVLVYTNADFPLWEKVAVTAFCNLIGVFIVKSIEKKTRKDKLWKVEATANKMESPLIEELLECSILSYSKVNANKNYDIYNIYCENQKESKIVKDILSNYNVKYFVTETKYL